MVVEVMAKEDGFPLLTWLIDGNHQKLERAARALDVSIPPRRRKVADCCDPYEGTPYGMDILETLFKFIGVIERDLRATISRLQGKTTYSAEDLESVADALGRLVQLTQRLATLAGHKPAFETYQRQIRGNAKQPGMRRSAMHLRDIEHSLDLAGCPYIAQVAELRNIPDLPSEVVDYFLNPEEIEGDRRKWLRKALKEKGRYVGQRGRPSGKRPSSR